MTIDRTIENFATFNSESIVDISCTHKLYGPGKITKLKFHENTANYKHYPEIYLSFESPVKTVIFAYSLVTKAGFLQFNELEAMTLQDLYTEYSANWNTYDSARLAEQTAQRVAKQEAKEAEKKAKADAQKAEAFERKKERDIKEFEFMVQNRRPLSIASEFYTTLGWLAKHTGTVSAALPDYLEPAFKKHFGDVPCRVVDSHKKGPAGWTSQWTSSFTVSLKKPDSIPAMLEQYLNPARKAVTNSEFVRDLVDNYGFQFGKVQDLEAIRSCVPSTYQTDFELGLAM